MLISSSVSRPLMRSVMCTSFTSLSLIHIYSIVRGTQLRDNVSDLYRYGAKEVHMRISCPPLLYPCKFLNFTASKSEMELITRRTIAEIEGNPCLLYTSTCLSP